MDERRRPRPAVFLLAAMAVLSILSGIGGIAVGGTSAQAGWWLAAIGLIFLAIVAVELARR
jgi:membrane associated rhomboid family serine protease